MDEKGAPIFGQAELSRAENMTCGKGTSFVNLFSSHESRASGWEFEIGVERFPKTFSLDMVTRDRRERSNVTSIPRMFKQSGQRLSAADTNVPLII